MEFAAGPPSKWIVTLSDGSVVEVWADGYGEELAMVSFSVLVDATSAEQEELEVTGRTPSRPERVIITVAKFPSAALLGAPKSA